MAEPAVLRCGHIALIGRPNVGKSTLLNRLLGQKLSITSRKPQTTRHRILGIKTTTTAQFVYVDTPGLQWRHQRALNRYMSRAATAALTGVDVVLLILEAGRWEDDDAQILARVREEGATMVAVVNKIDRLTDRSALLPYLEALSSRADFEAILPISATKGDNVERLEQVVERALPIAEPIYADDQVTDRSERFFAAEFIREQLIARLSEELPFRLSVEVEEFTEENSLVRIGAVIWVERRGHKAIVIGQGGSGLKAVGTAAREGLEVLLGRKVFLRLWVKVRAGWSDDERALHQLGYTDPD